MNEMLTGALRKAVTKENIKYLFSKFDIKTTREKIKYLEHAMYDPIVFYSCGSDEDSDELIEQKYDITLADFIEGSWKIHELYERLGIGG